MSGIEIHRKAGSNRKRRCVSSLALAMPKRVFVRSRFSEVSDISLPKTALSSLRALHLHVRLLSSVLRKTRREELAFSTEVWTQRADAAC
jgi:hypothetical protein